MTYKTIVVHQDAGERSAHRLDIALNLAEATEATLIGVFALEDIRMPLAAFGEGVGEVIQAELALREKAAAAGRARFDGACRRRGVRAEWRSAASDSLNAMLLAARHGDLCIIGQPYRGERRGESRGEDGGLPAWFAADFVLRCGRPVLLIPYAGRFEKVGQRVLVAWDAGREAARAVSDALPLLQRAAHVDVVVFDADRSAGRHGAIPGADFAAYLARHGVKVSVSQQQGTSLEVGEQILSRAADLQSDLIVMGAYGHSRMRELALGGATRTLLESMTVPVLMSH